MNIDKEKRNDILLNIAIAGALTGLAYVSYKMYKEYRAELERQRKEFEENEERLQEEIRKEMDDILEEEDRKKAIPEAEEDIFPDQDEVAVQYYEKEELMPGQMLFSEYKEQLNNDILEEEVEVLRHEINSSAALEQYKDMMTAEIRDQDVLERFWPLWDVSFEPKTEKDTLLKDTLIYDRADFFTSESEWITRISFAEVMLHFAHKAQYDLDYSIELSIKAWLFHLGIYLGMGAYSIESKVRSAEEHDVITPDELYTMFGLDDDAYLDMLGHIDDEKNSSFHQEYNSWIYFETGGN